MLLSLTLLTLSIVKVYCLRTYHENIWGQSIWEGSQVYIYKKDLFLGGQEMEEPNQ